ncbi:MAG: flagellar hook-associated protein FlgL [Candidatus Krumholzibacteriia bacterium]
MPIRISSNYMSNLLVNDLNRSLGNMLKLQQQAGSMQRILSYADDPRGVGAIQRYNTLIANNSQYLRNLTRSSVIIENTDTALQDVSSVLAEVRELVLRESSALANSETRATAQIEVDNLTNRLLDVLNSSVEGSYIFSGTRTDTVPFVRNGGTVVYQGNDRVMTAAVGPDADQDLNIPGSVFMGSISATMTGGQTLAPRLDGTTPLADLNLGSGWQEGSLRIADGAGNSWTVDLMGATTVDDVLTAINAATGGAVTAAIAPDGLGFELTGTGPLEVTEVGDGQTATSLGLRAASGGGTLDGRDIRPSIAAATLLTDIPALDGNLPLGSIEVEIAGVVTTVDFSGATSLGDLKTTFETAMPGFEFRLDAGGVTVISGSTEAFHIRNSGSPDTATLLGIEGTGSPQRMFGVMEDLRIALGNDDPDAIRAVLVELEELEQMVQTQLITNGGRQQDVEWTEGLLMQRDTQLRAKLSVERDADVAEISSALAQAQTTYQSSLLVTSKLFQSNLMMYL